MRLMDRILMLLAARQLGTAQPAPADLAEALGQIRATFDTQKFKRMRNIRNDIIHVNIPNTDPALNDVKELFEYAKDLIGKIESLAVIHQYQLGYGKSYE